MRTPTLTLTPPPLPPNFPQNAHLKCPPNTRGSSKAIYSSHDFGGISHYQVMLAHQCTIVLFTRNKHTEELKSDIFLPTLKPTVQPKIGSFSTPDCYADSDSPPLIIFEVTNSIIYFFSSLSGQPRTDEIWHQMNQI